VYLENGRWNPFAIIFATQLQKNVYIKKVLLSLEKDFVT
jgi:hypothetical protein